MYNKFIFLALLVSSLCCCNDFQTDKDAAVVKQDTMQKDYYGTLTPFASEAVYFVMTDRFVDGDVNNNFPEQGGLNRTYNRPLLPNKEFSENLNIANVGYMGGDFKGILDHSDYISEMGFTSIWISPIVDNPNEAFAGGEEIEFGGQFKDGGKTGYHGYWGVNFFKVDEHWPSPNLSFRQLTQQLRYKHGIKTVLDIVVNHGSPSFSMTPVDQPMFGEVYDADEKLVSDHQNLKAEDLDSNNPLHQFYNHKTEIVQLSDFDENNPQVLKYFVAAYLHWIEAGADAFRIDTLKHMPHSFWKKFADRIRIKHPNFFMFGESYDYDENFISQHTLPENGDISVLDFPGQKSITLIFENPSSDYKQIKNYLFLENSPYKNVYDLMTFYDNHDMQRMKADDNGFIDAHNWLFTSRGIPVIYYGSEMAFMAGTKEHMGNRNYFGIENIVKAQQHKIHKQLTSIANIRKKNISLQRGLQINLEFDGQHAAFFRVYEYQGKNQTALVLLNKGKHPFQFSIDKYLSEGEWTNAATHEKMVVNHGNLPDFSVDAHAVKVLFFNQKNSNKDLIMKMDELMSTTGISNY